jgi:hypothetical protein
LLFPGPASNGSPLNVGLRTGLCAHFTPSAPSDRRHPCRRVGRTDHFWHVPCHGGPARAAGVVDLAGERDRVGEYLDRQPRKPIIPCARLPAAPMGELGAAKVASGFLRRFHIPRSRQRPRRGWHDISRCWQPALAANSTAVALSPGHLADHRFLHADVPLSPVDVPLGQSAKWRPKFSGECHGDDVVCQLRIAG